MRCVLRQAALTAAAFAALYAAVLGITFLVSPDPPRDGRIDAWAAAGTLYLTGPKYAVLGRDVLDTPEPKVLLLGASNTGQGLRQADVQALLPCVAVSNLSIGASNISEVRQMVDLVHEVQDEAARRADTFVIGVWFGMFVDTERLWTDTGRQRGDTDIDIERYRYGLYRRTAAGPVPVLPPRWLKAEVLLIRPYLLLERVARDVSGGLRRFLHGKPPEPTDAEREAKVVGEEEKAERFAYWRQVMGDGGEISRAQVALLQETIEALLRSGEKVVLVDLPIPDWHRNASPYQPSYVREVQQGVFAHLAGRRGFTALTMPDLSAATGYTDEVHAKPSLARIWAGRLADVLRPLVCPADTAPRRLESGRPSSGVERQGVGLATARDGPAPR